MKTQEITPTAIEVLIPVAIQEFSKCTILELKVHGQTFNNQGFKTADLIQKIIFDILKERISEKDFIKYLEEIY